MTVSAEKELVHKPLKEEIFDALHRHIIAGKYGPGDWLRQEDIAGQMGVIMSSLDTRTADWTWRAATILMGLLMINFGNAWPRFPIPRQPELRPAMQTKYKRFYGWLIVVHGLLLALAALLPRSVVISAIVTVCLSLAVLSVGGLVMYYKDLMSPRAS